MSSVYTTPPPGRPRSSHPRRHAGFILLLAFLLSVCSTQAAKLKLRIRAGNPIDKPQKVKIKSDLPIGVTTNDILDLKGLDVGYDVKNGVYYVHKEIELGPREMALFDVEIRDIWVIPDGDLEALLQRAATLTDKLKGLPSEAVARAQKQDIENNVEQIRKRQTENAIRPGTKPIEHIRAYESNRKQLSRVKQDVGRIENLVFAAGLDVGPGELVWDDGAPSHRPRGAMQAPDVSLTAVVRIAVRNTSPTETRKVQVKHDLPPEVQMSDILDAGGLDIGVDVHTKTCYVFTNNLVVGPQETVAFDVKILDKWNVNGPWIVALKQTTDEMTAKVAARESLASIHGTLTALSGELEAIATAQGPPNLNEQYVAFYRDQTDRLNVIAAKLNRIKAALEPIALPTKKGFPVEPPSVKTTWLIIYIILGFLAFFSVMFFLRWFGKTKAEKM